ncbi:hypothetical protein SO694_00006060 [Aureococcus anophagefferens]|uniref:Glycosyl hydrolase family 67 C-terminal domain-containing protein n=1 Tax=Aureococcus anophagefferens TaxID=44056 RepID=A0ABR1GAE6_AURAN
MPTPANYTPATADATVPLYDYIRFQHYDAVAQVAELAKRWDALEGRVDDARFSGVKARFAQQVRDATPCDTIMGQFDAWRDGPDVGKRDGGVVGKMLGGDDGPDVGAGEGTRDGTYDGENDGDTVGRPLGSMLGAGVGFGVGVAVGVVGVGSLRGTTGLFEFRGDARAKMNGFRAKMTVARK